jgi:hypothetical protein
MYVLTCASLQRRRRASTSVSTSNAITRVAKLGHNRNILDAPVSANIRKRAGPNRGSPLT